MKPFLSWILWIAFVSVGVVTDSGRSYAGTITGEVRSLVDAPGNLSPHSPFARRRPTGEDSNSQAIQDETITIIVYLADDPRLQKVSPPEEEPVVNQQDLEIQPGFLIVPVGTTVSFPNNDDVYHNLFSVSSAKRFDLGRYGQGKEKEVTFDKPGDVRIFCDIHPHMNAIIFVVPNENYTVVGADGTFTLDNVPAGEYELHAWHETLGEQSKRINVPETGVTTVNFTFAHN